MVLGKPLRVSVVGMGRMGRLHLRHLLSLTTMIRVVAVSDTRPAARDEAAAGFGVTTYTDCDEMLDREKPQAVVITTPPASHADLIAKAAARGIHIFCEKPLALTEAEALEAARAVAQGRVVFQLGFQRRFDPAYHEAQKMIRAGVIGEPLTFKAVGRDDWRPDPEFARPEVSGGLLIDMAIHDFDLARWLMNSEVVRVSAEGSHRLYPELASVGDLDNAVVNLRFRSGAVGNVEASRTGTYGYDIRTEVVGAQGAIFVGQIEERSLVVASADGMRRNTFSGFESRYRDSYISELEEFAKCVLEERAPECGVRDGVRSLEIALAALDSMRSGKPVEVKPTMEV